MSVFIFIITAVISYLIQLGFDAYGGMHGVFIVLSIIAGLVAVVLYYQVKNNKMTGMKLIDAAKAKKLAEKNAEKEENQQ